MSIPAANGGPPLGPSCAETWLLRVAVAVVGGGGLVYAWFRYLRESDDPFSAVSHPAQPHLLHLHVLAAPLLVFALGALWRSHALRSWRTGVAQRRFSGRALLLTSLPMILTGPLVQVSVSDTWRSIWGVAHALLGLGWCLAYLVHQWRWRRNGRLPDGS